MFELHHERDVETSDLQGTNTVNALFNEVGTTSVTNYYLYQNLFLLAKYTKHKNESAPTNTRKE